MKKSLYENYGFHILLFTATTTKPKTVLVIVHLICKDASSLCSVIHNTYVIPTYLLLKVPGIPDLLMDLRKLMMSLSNIL